MAEINFHEIMEYFLEKAISVLFSLTLLISRGGVSHAKRNASGMVSVIIEVFWDRERPKSLWSDRKKNIQLGPRSLRQFIWSNYLMTRFFKLWSKRSKGPRSSGPVE